MKTSKLFRLTLFAGLFVFGIIVETFSQEVLPEITVTEARYKYLNSVNPEEAAQPVNMLEQYVASYDLKGAEFYEDEYDHYFVSFFIPNGKILAVYAKDGTLLHTAERYNNAALPRNILKAIANKYPKWGVSQDVYLVTYHQKDGSTSKIYKLVLQDGNKKIRIKVNDQAEFL
jgi:hypothetical protein